MARTESPVPPNGTQPVKKVQTTLMHSAHNFLSSPAKPSDSQSPHPAKRVITLAATEPPRSDDDSLSQSPPSQRLPSPPAPVSPLLSQPESGDATADDSRGADHSTPADTITAAAAAAAATPAEPADAAEPPAPAVAQEATPDVEAASSTPEPDAQNPASSVGSSARKKSHSAVRNLNGQLPGAGATTTIVASTFEQTVVSRKRSREPEADDTPAPADEETDSNIDAANGNDTTIQLGAQFEAEVEAEVIRAKSPVKEDVQVPTPAANGAEINVATAAAAGPSQAAAAEAVVDDDDAVMDDPKAGIYVIEKIIGHRPDPRDKTLFQMQVGWKSGDPTWEPEQTIQEDAEEALFAYWDGIAGGRLGAMADKDLWHVLRIEKHKQKPSGAVHLLVYWIGSPDRSWEPESQVAVYARQHVENYWRSKGGRENAVKSAAAAAAPGKRGRGRPRKDAATSATASEPAMDDEEEEVEEAVVKAAKPRGRPGRKQKRDEGGDDGAGNTQDAVAVEVDGEPPKKRGRGRPRKNPVS
ncbi:hypothetical protein LX36DRAFT_661204 [Colletotrichum falcatum]|nr:hypothetical protein LX36DRAFT_661204 [Colletotrichum falcatum]